MISNKSRHSETETLLARQLGHLIRSGYSYEEAFSKLQEVGEGGLKAHVQSLKKAIESEFTPSDGTSRHLMSIGTLRKLMAIARSEGGKAESIIGNAGEELGSLNESYLAYWAGMSSFLWYLASLSLIMVLLLILFSIFVFPQIEELYSNSQGNLPELTRITMSALDIFREVFFLVMIAIVIGVMVIAYQIRMAMKRLEPLSGMIAKFPGLATLSNYYNNALLIKLSRLLASTGITIDKAFQRVWELHRPNEDFENMISTTVPKLHLLVNQDPVWGAVILSRLTGTLDSEIVYLTAQAESIFAEQLAKLREEFTLIAQISVGVVIANLVISMYLPIFNLGSIF